MAGQEQTFALQVPSSTGNLAVIRDFVARVAAQAGLGDDDVAHLALAVDEACTNAIEHAHQGDVAKEVVVRAIFDETTLRIEVVDSGSGFDLDAVPPVDLRRRVRERQAGGLGVKVMRTLVDEVSCEFVPGDRNRVRLVTRMRKTQ